MRRESVAKMKCADVETDVASDPATAPRSMFLGELPRLWSLARAGWSRGTRPWLAIAVALTPALVALFLHFRVLSPELWRSGDVNASLSIQSELARLPMSLFFPTADLPLWGACAQLVIVIGLGELILGRRLTIAVAAAGHVGSTLLARVVMESAHGSVVGLTPAMAHILDTGPSAAATAVGACLLVSAKMNRCALLLGVSLVAAALIAPGLDGVEHTAALAVGVVVGGGHVVMSRVGVIRGVSWARRRSERPPMLLYIGRTLRQAAARLHVRRQHTTT